MQPTPDPSPSAQPGLPPLPYGSGGWQPTPPPVPPPAPKSNAIGLCLRDLVISAAASSGSCLFIASRILM